MTENAGALRLIDANANRCREGLRVIEEHARFVREDAALSERLKRLRHGLAEALAKLGESLPKGRRIEDYRDTAGDVGTAISTAAEAVRADMADTLRANAKRVQEALRVMEEYGKIISPAAAAMIEKLRYASYDLENMAMASSDRKSRLAKARLYVLITEKLASADALTVAREAVAGGADIIQMREKELEDKAFLERAEAMRNIVQQGGALFILNDRPHICQLVDADGIHTGLGDLPVNLSRRIIGHDRIIGRSTHCPTDAEEAFADGADYIGVGPVYPTKTKEHREAVGLEYVKYVAKEAKLPYFCIGSVNRDSLAKVLDAGARAVAVCTAIINAPDIAAETAWFKARLLERG